MPKGSGRRPLPTRIKKLRGNAGKRKLNEDEPQPPAREPEMPKDLSPAAKKQWKQFSAELLAMGVLTTADREALAALAISYARWWESEKEIDREGLFIQEPVTDKKGEFVGFQTREHPAVKTADKCFKKMKSILIEFGLTPAARTRLRVEKPPEGEDPLQALLKRNGKSQTPVHVN